VPRVNEHSVKQNPMFNKIINIFLDECDAKIPKPCGSTLGPAFLSDEQIHNSLLVLNEKPRGKGSFENSYFYASEKIWVIDIGALDLLVLLKDTRNSIHTSLKKVGFSQ
jgi:hypothetical protein